MTPIFTIIYIALNIYWWVVLIAVVFTWLYAFNVVNPRNQYVGSVGRFLYEATEPVLRPIRRVIPAFGSIDISPIILFLVITFVQILIFPYTDPRWT